MQLTFEGIEGTEVVYDDLLILSKDLELPYFKIISLWHMCQLIKNTDNLKVFGCAPFH